jgi:F0F1-type ATP synthase delta subunit
MPKWEINNEIIGGLVFKIGDTVIDTSLRHKLESFSKIMK